MRWEAILAFAMLAAAAPSAAAGYVATDSHDTIDADLVGDEDTHPVDEYHTWETLTVDLQRLVNENSGIARLHSAGESVLGFDLWVVEIANFRDENKTALDEREVVWLDGGTHANEQLGMELAYEWVEFLLTQYGENETATWIVDNRHTWIMPLVNPDGNHKDSRGNAHAVDLNRNYPVGWGALDEGRPPVGPGSYPLSEPETQAVVEWWAKTEPDYINSFHTGIELMLYPPGYEEKNPADQQVYRRVCEEIGEPDAEFCGPIHSTIYPAAGGSIDTSYERHGSISFAYELADEQGMYASVEDVRDRLERYWDGVEHAFLNVERYGAHPVVDEVSLDGDELALTVTNEGYGNLSWADVDLQVPGAEDPTVTIEDLPAGESTNVTASVPADDAEEERIGLELHYPERKQGSPMETRTQPLPVAIQDGELTASPLEGEELAGETLASASVDEADDGNLVPGPGAIVASLALALVARVRKS